MAVSIGWFKIAASRPAGQSNAWSRPGAALSKTALVLSHPANVEPSPDFARQSCQTQGNAASNLVVGASLRPLVYAGPASLKRQHCHNLALSWVRFLCMSTSDRQAAHAH